ncbi:MAG: hypothetical protein RLZZ459_1962, partial [Cyanobacteriota bacterium]
GLLLVKQAESLFAVLSADHAIAGQLQTHHQNAADGRFVIDDEQGGAVIAAIGSVTTILCGITLPVLLVEGHTQVTA